jgi:hypothetical protein
MVRLVLATVVTSGLLAASAPALSDASVDRTDAAVERQVRELSARLATFVATNDPTEDGNAQVVATLRLPARSITAATVERVTFTDRGGTGVVTWQVGADHRSSRVLVERPLRPEDGQLVLESSGSHRLVFSLHRDAGRSVVTVDRVGGSADGGDDARLE